MASTSTPKHLEVYQRLREEISSGTYTPGQRMPTETELVERFGVSRPTVSRALGILEQEGHLVRRRGSGTYLKGRSTINSALFGLLIPRLHYNGIGGPIAAGITKRADSLGHGLLLASAMPDGDEESGHWAERFCEQFIRHDVKGVFLVPLELHEGQTRLNRAITDQLDAAEIAVMLIDRDVRPYPERSSFDLIGIDNRRAGHDLAAHMLAQGCRRFAFVADHLESSSALERAEGCRYALQVSDAEFINDRIAHWNPSYGGEPLLDLVREHQPDALIFVNDLLARDAIGVLTPNGVTIPEQIRIAAFDDLPFSKSLSVPLTTVRQPFEALGTNAVEAMVSRLRDPSQPARDIRLAGELVIRRSTKV